MTNRELIFDDGLFIFETVMRVRNSETDDWQHLTLESLTTLLAEARALFFYSKGIKGLSVDYNGLIINNLQLNVVSQVCAREYLLFEVGVERLCNDKGDIAIKVTRMSDGSLVAKARQHFINYDYRLNKAIPLNIMVKNALNQLPS